MKKFYDFKSMVLLVASLGGTSSALGNINSNFGSYTGSWYNLSPIEEKAGFLEWQPLDVEFIKDGKITSHVYYTYDEDGFVIKRIKKNANGENDEMLTFERDADHHITQMIVYSYDKDWVPNSKYTYAYDKQAANIVIAFEIRNWDSAGHWGGLHYNSQWAEIEKDSFGRVVTITEFIDVDHHSWRKKEFSYADNNPVSFPVTYRISWVNVAHTQFFPKTEYRNIQWEGEPNGDEITAFVQYNDPFNTEPGRALLHYESWDIENGANELTGTYDKDVISGNEYKVYYTRLGDERKLDRHRFYVTEKDENGYDEFSNYNSNGLPLSKRSYREDHLGCQLLDSYMYRSEDEEDWKRSDGYTYEYEYTDNRAHATEIKRWYSDESSYVQWNFGRFVHFDRTGGVGEISIDNTDSEVMYYNLQGVKISHPQKNTVCIKVANGKASKILN